MGQVQGAAVRIREAKGQLHGECTMIKHREMSAKGVKCSHGRSGKSTPGRDDDL